MFTSAPNTKCVFKHICNDVTNGMLARTTLNVVLILNIKDLI